MKRASRRSLATRSSLSPTDCGSPKKIVRTSHVAGLIALPVAARCAGVVCVPHRGAATFPHGAYGEQVDATGAGALALGEPRAWVCFRPIAVEQPLAEELAASAAAPGARNIGETGPSLSQAAARLIVSDLPHALLAREPAETMPRHRRRPAAEVC